MGFTFSQKVESVILVVLIIFYFAAADTTIATMFVLGIIMSGCILMVGTGMFMQI